MLHTEVCNAFANNQQVYATIFDMHKAFDTTWRYSILQSLETLRLKGNLPIFVQNFLHDRTFRVKMNNCLSTTFQMENGIPQGTSISTTLFLIVINDIGRYIKHPVQFSLFVYDLMLLIRTKNNSYAEKYLQQTINELENWSLNSGLQFSPNKTQCKCLTETSQGKPQK